MYSWKLQINSKNTSNYNIYWNIHWTKIIYIAIATCCHIIFQFIASAKECLGDVMVLWANKKWCNLYVDGVF